MPPEGNSRLRRGKIPAAALRAHFRYPWIHVVPRTKFDPVAPPAEVAVKRLARRDTSAVVAILHGVPRKNGCGDSPRGRSHSGPNGPSRSIASRLENQKNISVGAGRG